MRDIHLDENSNITKVSKASRKMFTIYVSVYNVNPPFTAQICGGKVRIIHGERRATLKMYKKKETL